MSARMFVGIDKILILNQCFLYKVANALLGPGFENVFEKSPARYKFPLIIA